MADKLIDTLTDAIDTLHSKWKEVIGLMLGCLLGHGYWALALVLIMAFALIWHEDLALVLIMAFAWIWHDDLALVLKMAFTWI